MILELCVRYESGGICVKWGMSRVEILSVIVRYEPGGNWQANICKLWATDIREYILNSEDEPGGCYEMLRCDCDEIEVCWMI